MAENSPGPNPAWRLVLAVVATIAVVAACAFAALRPSLLSGLLLFASLMFAIAVFPLFHERFPRISQYFTAASVIFGVIVGLLGLQAIQGGPPAGSTATQAAPIPTPATPLPYPSGGPTTAPADDSQGETLGCQPAEVTEKVPLVELCVVRWCQDLALRNQVEIKIKPKLTNNSDKALQVGIGAPSPWRLIVSSDVPVAKWSPPRATEDHPIPLTLNGNQVWGIPPNPDGVAEHLETTDQGVFYTFATHWKHTQLAPGHTLYDRARKSGDLVFYYPHVGDARWKTAGLLGLALVQGGRIVAFTPVAEWGTRSAMDDF